MPKRSLNIRLAALVVVVVSGYLTWITTWGAGFDFGDEGFWLLKGREVFRTLPRITGNITPLTFVISGAWLFLTEPLGLFGARLGWVAVNAASAVLVFLGLSRYFPPLRSAVAVITAAPMICTGQFMTLEYNNIPWAFLVVFALAFVKCQRRDLGDAAATAWALLAGIALATALLSRLLLLPALLLPLTGWKIAGSGGRVKPMLACYLAALVGLALGSVWLWYSGAIPELLDSINAARSLGSDAESVGRRHYSSWRLISVYIAHALIGLEQFAVVGLLLLTFVLGSLAWLTRLSALAITCLVAGLLAGGLATSLLAPVAALGVFGPRYDAGFPFITLVFCGIQLCRYWRMPATPRTTAIRQLLLFSIAIPVLVMAGSNLGFLRMISSAWLAAPLAIVLIPEAAVALRDFWERILPDSRCDATRATRRFLYAVVAVMVVFATSREFARSGNSGSPLKPWATLRHPKLRWIRETPTIAGQYDEMLDQVATCGPAGSVVLAYPHLEMVYWVTDTAPPPATYVRSFSRRRDP